MKKIVSLAILMACLIGPLQAIPQLPAKAMGKPKVFMNEKESYRWAEIAQNKNWGELSNSFWLVYVDRSDVVAREKPSASARQVGDKLGFMDAYYVAKIEGDYALLYEEKYVQSNLQISMQAKPIGWVELKYLLLWNTCPRTPGQVYKKAVIVKDPDEMLDKSDIDEVSPLFLSSPVRMKDKDHYRRGQLRAVELEFYFVYKISDEGAALLVAESSIPNKEALANVPRYGWMRDGNYTIWDSRLCYEPNFGNPAIKYHAAVFSEKSDAKEYKATGKIGSSVLWHDKLPGDRWSPKTTRFPVLDMVDKTIAQIGTLGSAGGSATYSEQVAETQKKIDEAMEKVDELQRKMAQINIVFVIDGTGSMKNYYKPVADAITDAMNQTVMQGAKVRFGAVIYRNYADGDDMVETMDLTDDATSVARFIAGRNAHSEGKTHEEAMYHGLVTALKVMNWDKKNANFLIHIGDAGNLEPDPQHSNYTREYVAKLMADKEINYIAFQANRLDDVAYDNFKSQTRDLMLMELKQLRKGDVRLSDFVDDGHRLKEVKKTVKGNQIIVAAMHYAELGRPESTDLLKELIERKITDFKALTNQEIARFNSGIDGMAGNSRPMAAAEAVQFENIDEFLRDRGFTDEEIATLKKRGVVLKFKGYTSLNANAKETFVPCVFMAHSELNELIKNLDKITKSSTNRRKDLQETLETLALSYVGQSARKGDMTIDEIMEAVSGIKKGTGKSVFGVIKPENLLDPVKVPDNQLNEYVNRIIKDRDNLRNKTQDRTCFFESPNGGRYYYILMDDMPLQGDRF